ncbi:hypothetical protein Tco_1308747, partial [Tanacetum coccineum]
MNENTVCLWLKDHQDAMEKLAQQQVATFQALFDKLRAELQATHGLLQNLQRARFEERNRFRPSKYEDPNGALSKLLQLGMVKDHQRDFEKLINRARFDDQAALVAGTSAGLKANKVVNVGDDSESSGSVTLASDSESSSKIETKVLVEGKQDEVKVVKVVVVADEQNSDE